MKIETKLRGYVAILQEKNGDVVGVFMPSPDSRKSVMETAVCMHFDVPSCSLVNQRDFTQLVDYHEEFTFILYNGSGSGDDDEYVDLIMTFAPLFTEVDTIHRKEVTND